VGSIAALADTAGVHVTHVAGLELIRAEDAPALLAAFTPARLRVLGVEGFRIEGSDGVRPAMDAILDLSGLDDAAKSVVEAEQFIGTASAPDVFFEFTVDEAGGRT
jgi:hypothetical protein